jgi:hypothetical protein
MAKKDWLACADFPKEEYSAYWETAISGDGDEFHCKITSYDTHELLDELRGGGDSREDCIEIAHVWLRAEMPNYKRD